jgi:hypothetical protein
MYMFAVAMTAHITYSVQISVRTAAIFVIFLGPSEEEP